MYAAVYHGRGVAVKRLPLGISTPAQKRDFLKEIRLLVQLRHESLVVVHGVCEDVDNVANTYAVVMELMHMSVAHAIAKVAPSGEPLPPMTDLQRAKCVMSVTAVLTYLHMQKPAITHGDIKPENILVNCDTQYKLVDFGISRVQLQTNVVLTQTTRMGARSDGTPQYMAPELYEEDPVYGTFNDVYALACVIMQLYSGQLPYPKARTPQQLWMAIAGGSPKIPAAVPNVLHPILQRCLLRDHELRPTTTEVLNFLTNAYSTMLAHFTMNRECLMCREDMPIVSGWLCQVTDASQSHFVCHDCIEGIIRNATEGLDAEARIDMVMCCPIPKCTAEPWTKHHVIESAKHSDAGKQALRWYITKQQELAKGLIAASQDNAKTIAKLAAEVEAFKLKDQKELADKQVRAYRNHIVEKILCICCPRCKRAFNDFDGCFALSCCDNEGKRGCMAGFCGYCLQDCGADAHEHVRVAHGNLWGKKEEFDRIHVARRQKLVQNYLDTEVKPEYRAALILVCRRDFIDLGIVIADVEVQKDNAPVQRVQRVHLRRPALRDQFRPAEFFRFGQPSPVRRNQPRPFAEQPVQRIQPDERNQIDREREAARTGECGCAPGRYGTACPACNGRGMVAYPCGCPRICGHDGNWPRNTIRSVCRSCVTYTDRFGQKKGVGTIKCSATCNYNTQFHIEQLLP